MNNESSSEKQKCHLLALWTRYGLSVSLRFKCWTFGPRCDDAKKQWDL